MVGPAIHNGGSRASHAHGLRREGEDLFVFMQDLSELDPKTLSLRKLSQGPLRPRLGHHYPPSPSRTAL